jgi:DNA-binding transcriptional ArsR family regulator
MSDVNAVVQNDKDWHFSVSKNFVCNNKLSIGARLLMVVLRSFVGFKENSCFPGRDHLCDILDINKDTLTKWMKELKDAGYVKVEQKKLNGSKFGKNTYITGFEPCPTFSDTKASDTKASDTTDSPLRYTTIQHLPLSEELPLKKTPIVPKGTCVLDSQAGEIYGAYPKKVGKPDALKAIKRALQKKSFEYLLEKTKEYCDIRGGNLSYVPNPSTWFNQERYDDSPSTWYPYDGASTLVGSTNNYGLPE